MSQGERYFNSLNEEPGAIRVHARGQQMSSSSRETRSAEFHHRVGMTLRYPGEENERKACVRGKSPLQWIVIMRS